MFGVIKLVDLVWEKCVVDFVWDVNNYNYK